MLFVHLLYAVDNGIQAELAVPGLDIDSAAGIGYFSEGLFIEFRHHDVSILVLEKSSVHRDRLALRRPHAYGIYPYPHIESLLCGSDRIILMVFSIGNDYYGPAFLALGAETPYGGIDGISHRSSLDRDRFGRNRIQEHLCGNVVCRDRKLDE